ncbi:MAG: TIGR02556 family CRISPR-associated protein [Candidatus Altiarchaeia archaeon]
MIQAIKEIGEYSLEKEGKSIEEPLEILVGNPANKTTENIIFINLQKTGEKLEYSGVTVEAYSKDKLKKYLYRKGSSRGTDITPTAMITDVEGTFNLKIVSWFKNYNSQESDSNQQFLFKIGNTINEAKKKITNDLNAKYDKKSNIISLKIDGKYIGEYEIFKRILIETAKKDFYFTKSFPGDNCISKSENQVCSVCNQKSLEVYGFVNTFKFYTVDKRGFVSGGFQQKNAWKNYPVCLKCALTLEEGKKYMKDNDNLNFNFYGFSYLLIPKFLGNVDKATRKNIFKIIEQQKDPKFGKEGKAISSIKRISDDETEIFDLLSEQKNYMNINFMFYDAPRGYDGSEFYILNYIENVLPSRLKTIFEAKSGNREKDVIGVDQISVFKECKVPIFKNKKKIGDKSLEFDFGILKNFFYDYDNKRWISDRYFLDIVDKIFNSQTVDYDFLLTFIVRRLQRDFKENHTDDKPTKVSTLRGLMLLKYLSILNLIKSIQVSKMENNKWNKFKDEDGVNETDKRIESFFGDFSDFFNDDAKKAVFLEGALTQLLLDIQRLPEVSNASPGSEPFRARLRGLKLDEKHVKRIFPEIQAKLDEYKKNYYKRLETTISEYMTSAGHKWSISNDDICFYFVLGMNLSYLFKSKKENSDGDKK